MSITPCSSVSIVNFEQANADWEVGFSNSSWSLELVLLQRFRGQYHQNFKLTLKLKNLN